MWPSGWQEGGPNGPGDPAQMARVRGGFVGDPGGTWVGPSIWGSWERWIQEMIRTMATVPGAYRDFYGSGAGYAYIWGAGIPSGGCWG